VYFVCLVTVYVYKLAALNGTQQWRWAYLPSWDGVIADAASNGIVTVSGALAVPNPSAALR